MTGTEIIRARNLRNNYDITPEEYEAKLKAQNGVCAICGKPPTGGKTSSSHLHVDHSHITNENRGLLCNRCNPGIGQFDESIERLQKAINYLNSYV